MKRGRTLAAQSIVEFALIAPILIVLAMAAWDGGSVLREVLVLQDAARNGARAGATAYGGTTQLIVTDAVIASAGDLPALTAGMVSVSNGDAQSITVKVQYPHTLITPVLRQLWGGGTVTLSASATFFVPQLTATPLAITPSTPTPTPTLTPTPVTATATATPAPTSCAALPNGGLSFLGANSGYWCTLSISSRSSIWAYWQDDNDTNNTINIYANNPFTGQPDPSPLDPNKVNSTNLAYNFRYFLGGALWGQTSTCVPPGTYAVYFFNRGNNSIPASPAGVGSSSC